MKKTRLVAGLLLLLCLAACVHKEKPKSKTLVIVLCDVSNSTTLYKSETARQGRLGQLQQYVKLVPKWYPVGSAIYYYPVSDNKVSDELGKVQYIMTTRSKEDAQFAIANQETDRVNSKLEELASQKPSSCIVSSVQRCVTRLKELKNEKYNCYELVIVSDMLETCAVNMDPQKKESFKKAIQNFVGVSPLVDISDLSLKVKVLINTPGIGNEYDDVKNVWLQWFTRSGVASADINFYTADPHFQLPVFNKPLQ